MSTKKECPYCKQLVLLTLLKKGETEGLFFIKHNRQDPEQRHYVKCSGSKQPFTTTETPAPAKSQA